VSFAAAARRFEGYCVRETASSVGLCEFDMTRRSRAREVALQLLFQRDHNPKIERSGLEQFARDRLRETPLQEFCLQLYDGVVSHMEEIDKRISAAAENWRLPRMPTVDRNVLRLRSYELPFCA